MGHLIYGHSSLQVEFDDRFLAHAQIAIGTKLRRKESFFFSWTDDASVGSGRSTIWIDTSIPLYFRYSGSRPITINRDWLELLNGSANSAKGLAYLLEPGSTRRLLPQSRV